MEKAKYKKGDKIRLVSYNYIKHFGKTNNQGNYIIKEGSQSLTIVPDMILYLGKEFLVLEILEDDKEQIYYRLTCENIYDDKRLSCVSNFIWRDWIFRKPLDELLFDLKGFCKTCIKECEGEDCVVNNILKNEL